MEWSSPARSGARIRGFIQPNSVGCVKYQTPHAMFEDSVLPTSRSPDDMYISFFDEAMCCLKCHTGYKANQLYQVPMHIYLQRRLEEGASVFQDRQILTASGSAFFPSFVPAKSHFTHIG